MKTGVHRQESEASREDEAVLNGRKVMLAGSRQGQKKAAHHLVAHLAGRPILQYLFELNA